MLCAHTSQCKGRKYSHFQQDLSCSIKCHTFLEDVESVCRSIQRQLRKKLVRLPSISPAPDSAQPDQAFRKTLSAAQKIKKESGDAYLGVDTLLRALVETSKDMQEALNEAGDKSACSQSVD